MSDVVAPPKPRRKPKTQVLAEVGQPFDRDAGRKRLERFRARKKVKKVTVQHAVRMDIRLSNALRELEERHDTPMNAILKRFIEDGIKKYGPDLCEMAGLAEKANPFDSFTPKPPARTYVPNASPGYQFSVANAISLDDPTAPSAAQPPIPEGE